MKAINRSYHAPGSLDRLTDYAQGELITPFAKYLCNLKKHDDCPADECDGCPGMEAMCQLEYDLQTEVILFAEKLIAEWVEGST